MEGKAKKDLRAGMLVSGKLTRKGIYVFEPLIIQKKKNFPLGIAARDIKKGEIIEWNPLKNTKDILRK